MDMTTHTDASENQSGAGELERLIRGIARKEVVANLPLIRREVLAEVVRASREIRHQEPDKPPAGCLLQPKSRG